MAPEDLTELAKRIDTLRTDALFDETRVPNQGNDPEAEQLVLLALAALESAARFATLASIKESQALAAYRCG